MSHSTDRTAATTMQTESSDATADTKSQEERLLSSLHVKSLRVRFLLAFLLIVLVTAIPISIGAVGIAQRSGQNQILNQLESVAVVKQGIIDTWLDSLNASLASMTPPGEVSNSIEAILSTDNETPKLTLPARVPSPTIYAPICTLPCHRRKSSTRSS